MKIIVTTNLQKYKYFHKKNKIKTMLYSWLDSLRKSKSIVLNNKLIFHIYLYAQKTNLLS